MTNRQPIVEAARRRPTSPAHCDGVPPALTARNPGHHRRLNDVGVGRIYRVLNLGLIHAGGVLRRLS